MLLIFSAAGVAKICFNLATSHKIFGVLEAPGVGICLCRNFYLLRINVLKGGS
jgi:hypothetical protein